MDSLSGWCVDDTNLIKFWKSNKKALKLLTNSFERIEDVTLGTVVEKSENFSIKIPVDSVKVKALRAKIETDVLEKYINSAYPIVHEKVLQLCALFILEKSGSGGSKIENELYKNITICGLLNRLLLKRAVMFIGPRDLYQLYDGEKGFGNWETIGTANEEPPLVLSNYISYDEIKISALLSVTSYTHFLNDGNRHNNGVYDTDRKNIENEGVIVGLIGPRFQKMKVMDSQEIIKSPEDDIKPGIFFEIYEEKFCGYKDISHHPGRFTDISKNRYFDNAVYCKRIALSFDTFIHEANHRAKMSNTFAYVHVVGIGLGVWKVGKHQNKLFVETCFKRLEQLGCYLHHISDVCFSYMQLQVSARYENGDTIPIKDHPKGGFKIHIYDRQPHTKLETTESKLLVVSFAWDGNALPGNEFWRGSLDSSGDPAAACSTQIAELHNAHINPKLRAENIRIATYKGVMTLKEYQEYVLKSIA